MFSHLSNTCYKIAIAAKCMPRAPDDDAREKALTADLYRVICMAYITLFS